MLIGELLVDGELSLNRRVEPVYRLSRSPVERHDLRDGLEIVSFPEDAPVGCLAIDRPGIPDMQALGGKISPDDDHGLIGVAFNPFERDGGGVSRVGQINLDSGSLNPEQITEVYGKQAGTIWAKSRLRDRWDALIAHEDAEFKAGGDHNAAVKTAPETELPISDQARKILVEMKRGWNGR
jgi:hypothetical protein